MIAVTLVCLLAVGLAQLTPSDVQCGKFYITDPENESCCNGLPFFFRTQYCCNGRIQSTQCPPIGLLNLQGPSLVFRVDDSVDMDNDGDDEGFGNTELEDGQSDEFEATETGENAEVEDEDMESLEESDDDDDESVNDDEESANDDDNEESVIEDDEDDEESAGDMTGEIGTFDDGDDGEFGAAFDKDGGASSSLNNNNNGVSTADMDYYVKITLINMWLILGLILVVNIIFYWCYCRRNQARLDRVKSNNMFVEDPMGQQTDIDV